MTLVLDGLLLLIAVLVWPVAVMSVLADLDVIEVWEAEEGASGPWANALGLWRGCVDVWREWRTR